MLDDDLNVYEQRMRKQTERYVNAVYRAHPELLPKPKALPMPVEEPPAEYVVEMTPELVEQLIKRLENEAKPRWKPLSRAIIKAVAMKHDVRIHEIMGTSRERQIVHARQEAMFQIRETTPLSLPQIARMFGKDHSTVVHAVKAHKERIAK